MNPSTPNRPEPAPTVNFRLETILDQVATQPFDHLVRRLRSEGGGDWFQSIVRREIDRECGSPKDLHLSLEEWTRLKEIGKSRLAAARLTEEVEEAMAIYFAAVVRILADARVQQLERVCSLPAVVLEEVLLTFQESLDDEWIRIADQALRFVD